MVAVRTAKKQHTINKNHVDLNQGHSTLNCRQSFWNKAESPGVTIYVLLVYYTKMHVQIYDKIKVKTFIH